MATFTDINEARQRYARMMRRWGHGPESFNVGARFELSRMGVTWGCATPAQWVEAAERVEAAYDRNEGYDGEDPYSHGSALDAVGL